MTLSELAVSIKGTRTTALRVLRNLSEKGLVSLSIEKMKPIRARIIQKVWTLFFQTLKFRVEEVNIFINFRTKSFRCYSIWCCIEKPIPAKLKITIVSRIIYREPDNIHSAIGAMFSEKVNSLDLNA